MADIKLKDLNGKTQTYTGKTRIMVDTEEGPEIFSQGDAIEAGTIELDFKDGDMELSAANGMLIKSATIKKPDALRPENIAADIEIAGISGTFQGGGDGYSARQIAERTMFGPVEDVNASFIGSYAFANQDITAASFPSCKTIYHGAFSGCTSLSTADFDTCLSAYSYAFDGCSSLTSAYLPLCSTAPERMFRNCTSLSSIILDYSNIASIYSDAFCSTLITSISVPVCSAIGSTAFSSCKYLSDVYAPSTHTVNYGAFFSCSELQRAQLSTFVGNVYSHAFDGCCKLSDIGEVTLRKVFDYGFRSCSQLTSVSFTNGYCYIGSNAFYGCIKLSKIYGCIYLGDLSLDTGMCIGDWAFASCSRLESITMCFGSSAGSVSASYIFTGCDYLSRLTLSPETVVVPVGSEFFDLSPFTESHMLYSRYGYYSYASIYVPSSLYSQFRSAPGWSLVSARMVRYTPSSSST